MYLLEPTEQAKAAAKKRVTVVEYEYGGVSIRYRGVPLAARPFHKDGCVTQPSIVDNKLLSGALTEIRKRQQQREQELVRSAKSKREKRIVADRFANRLPPPGPWNGRPARCLPTTSQAIRLLAPQRRSP